MLERLSGLIFGIPGTAAEKENAYRTVIGNLDPLAATERMRDGVQHNTEKAGALLAAQGIFTVADTFALDHGWPRLPILVSLGCLIVGTFLVMSILRSTMRMYRNSQVEPTRAVYALLLSRMIRFNAALYLTFLSILLLGIAALSFV